LIKYPKPFLIISFLAKTKTHFWVYYLKKWGKIWLSTYQMAKRRSKMTDMTSNLSIMIKNNLSLLY